MAERPAWRVQKRVEKINFSFEWNGGFAVSQKKKNIVNLHAAIGQKYAGKALEISTKSDSTLGQNLSAFHLKIGSYYLENVFQSSKVYQNGGPYLDMLDMPPKDAKRDERHQTSGKLTGFSYSGVLWELNPKTLFYDYLYLLAVKNSLDRETLQEICDYEWFTDIEFNPKKSINCQARSAALLKYVVLNEQWDVLDSKDKWLQFHIKMIKD